MLIAAILVSTLAICWSINSAGRAVREMMVLLREKEEFYQKETLEVLGVIRLDLLTIKTVMPSH